MIRDLRDGDLRHEDLSFGTPPYDVGFPVSYHSEMINSFDEHWPLELVD